ncbi:hypothetical protein WUBG_00883, partial [Wuchereria bancrofti]
MLINRILPLSYTFDLNISTLKIQKLSNNDFNDGLICNKPEDPIEFLESSLGKVRQNPSFEYKWDSFVDKKVLQEYDQPSVTSGLTVSPPEKPKKKAKSRTSGTKKQATRVSPNRSVVPSTTTTNNKSSLRPSSVMQTAEAASIPDVPIVLFM